MLNHFKSVTNDLPSDKVYQVSMDGPNINLKFCKEFSRLYKEENCNCLIDLGTCSLHAVHNSFRTGVETTGWNIKKVLKDAFHVLRNSPARREDFESQTGSTTYTFKFCYTVRTVSVKGIHRSSKKINDSLP